MKSNARRNRAVAALSDVFLLACVFSLFSVSLVATNSANAAPAGKIETYVGGGNGDGDDAINAAIDPRGIALVGSANAPDIYVADGKNNRVRRVDGDTGIIETIAGDGDYGYDGDGGDPQNASLKFPLDVAVDSAGNVYVADTFNDRIRKVGTDRRITTFAGNGSPTYSGEGRASEESLNNPYGVTVGPDGNVYIADLANKRVRRVSPPNCAPANCVMSTVAGSGASGFGGDNGPAANAAISPADVAFDGAGNMYIADRGNLRVRRVTPGANGLGTGTITTIAGGGSFGPGGTIPNNVPALNTVLLKPTQIFVDSSGNVYIADTTAFQIRMLQPAGSAYTITTVAGVGGTNGGWSGDGGAATAAMLFNTWGIAVTSPGTFWLSQSAEAAVSPNNRVRKVTSGVIRSVVGGGNGDGSAAVNAIVDPRGAEAVDNGGTFPDLYFADGTHNTVRHVDGDTGLVDTIAGTGTAGYSGDNSRADNATLRTPFDVAVDASSGVVYIADTFNHVIRKVAANGIITTVAGTGQPGFNQDGPATQRNLNAPRGIDVDRAGNLYIADTENNRVRKLSGGQLVTIAGNGTKTYNGDDIPAVTASLRSPTDVLVADNGTVYIADSDSNRIRRIDPGSGKIYTFAGNGNNGFAGEGIPATNATLNDPSYLSLDNGGNLYIADYGNNRIRRVTTGGIIETVAGNGQALFSGDGGQAVAAGLGNTSGVAIDPSGSPMFISSQSTARVRIVEFSGVQPPATATYTATPIPPQNTSTPIPPQNTPTRTPTTALSPTRTPTRTTAAPLNVAVSGQVSYYANSQVRVPGVQVDLHGPETQTVLTNSSGSYSASDIPAGTWEIEPAKQGSIGNAVSSLDASKVLQVIAGRISFDKYQNLACDVTGDGTLSVLDAVRILQLSAGVIEQFAAGTTCGSDWIFYPRPDPAQNQTVAVPSLSTNNCKPGNILLNPMLTTVRDQDFDAILLGDCTGNWTPSAGGALRLSAPSGVTVHAGALRRAPGNRYRMPIYVQGASSFQALDFKLVVEAEKLTLLSARARGAAAESLTSAHTVGNVVAVSMASADEIDATAGSVLMLEFIGHDESADEALMQLVTAQVDEQAARLVTH